MAVPPSVAAQDPVRELASRIYVELVCRHTAVTDTSAKFGANPEHLARLSFKLADTFHRAEQELKAASLPPTVPKNDDFDLRSTDLSGLMGVRPD